MARCHRSLWQNMSGLPSIPTILCGDSARLRAGAVGTADNRACPSIPAAQTGPCAGATSR